MSETNNKPVEGEVVTPPAKPAKKTKEEKALEVRQQEIRLDKAEKVATEGSSAFNPIIYSQLKNLADDLIKGGATSADASTPEQLIVKLQAGFELGMTPVESLNSLYIVNGRVTIWGAALIKRLRLAGWSVRYRDESADSCTIEVSKDGETIEDTFNFKDAQDSGYTTNNNGGLKVGWKLGQNRKLKMRYGAASQLVKTYLPEVLGTIAGVAEIDQDAPDPTQDHFHLPGATNDKDEIVKRIQAAAAKNEKIVDDTAEAKPLDVDQNGNVS